MGSSTAIFPEANDFLAAKLFEDFDETTLKFSLQYLTTPLNTNVTIIAARYIVLSYGTAAAAPDFTHALIYDLTLKRWGKLKITHRDCFEWNFPNLYGQLTYGQLNTTNYGGLLGTTYAELSQQTSSPQVYKEEFCFLQGDGTVQIVNFDFSEETADGVMVCGKFQFSRNERIEHQECQVDTVDQGNSFQYYVIASYDGKTLQTPVPGFLVENGPQTRLYKKLVEGLNVSRHVHWFF